jgi:hypothetical protein
MKKLGIVIILLALLPLSALHAQDDPCYANNGSPDETGQCFITGGLDIKLAYPVELADYPYADGVVADFLHTLRTTTIQNYASSDPAFLNFPWSLYGTYEIYQFSETVLSINFTLGEYTGGAHPNSYFHSFTFDLAAEQELELADIFAPDSDPFSVIGPLVQADLILQQGGNADPTWIEEGTGTNPDNYQEFALNEDSLILFFPPYQVGPYALGQFAVVLPLADLDSILAEPFKRN